MSKKSKNCRPVALSPRLPLFTAKAISKTCLHGIPIGVRHAPNGSDIPLGKRNKLQPEIRRGAQSRALPIQQKAIRGRLRVRNLRRDEADNDIGPMPMVVLVR